MTTQTLQPFPKILGTELFLVGGSVRDTLLGRPAKDRDFVALTDLSFAEFTSAVETIGKVFQAREEFLTLRCLIEGEPIDIAFPRAEFGFSDARHPDAVERVSTLEEDASRRDFTINAMFMRENGEIIDFFGGKQDLKDRLIRAVGSPKERFNEDALRILRAVRFACKLSFEIDPITALHMEVQAPLIRNISIERVQIELSQALQANPLKAFQEIANLAIFSDLAEMGLSFEATLKKRK